jgi:hypothetical protein
MNPRAEAEDRLGGRYEARVLEPSPPAVAAGPWFADDPVARGSAERPVVSPVPTGDVLWSELAAGDEDLFAWCSDRWLVCGRRLGAVPDGLVSTRLALHRLAERVISPARRAVNGKIGLRFTRGGFGTPFFGPDVQVRVEGDELVVSEQGAERRSRITTLAAAAGHVGREPLPEVDDGTLEVDPQVSRFLGDWWGFAAHVLETLRAAAADASRVQLWPEHFDLAVELGSEAAGARATYGFSPGDERHPEPYLYVGPWVAPAPGELWQATGFAGAELGYAALFDAPDQREAALEFFRVRLAALA